MILPNLCICNIRSTCTINYTKELPLAQVKIKARFSLKSHLSCRELSLNETLLVWLFLSKFNCRNNLCETKNKIFLLLFFAPQFMQHNFPQCSSQLCQQMLPSLNCIQHWGKHGPNYSVRNKIWNNKLCWFYLFCNLMHFPWRANSIIQTLVYLMFSLPQQTVC